MFSRLENYSARMYTHICEEVIIYMKTVTCKQLGGACDKEFHAETFEEMAQLSKQHGMEMHGKADEEHLKVIEKMKELMKNPEAMKEWMEKKQKEFDALPEDK